MTNSSSPGTSTPASAEDPNDGVLLLFSPLDEPRFPAFSRIVELHRRVVLLTERPDAIPRWAAARIHRVVAIARTDVPAARDAITRFLDEAGTKIDGIVSLSETGLFFCAQLALALGIPFTSPEHVTFARDKSRMRQIFAEHGLPTVAFSTAATVAEGLEAAERIGFPVVLKPLLAGGSLFVHAVHSPAELSAAFDLILRGGVEAVGGDPLVVDSFAAGTRPRLLVEKLIGGETLYPSSLDLPVGEISAEGCVIDGRVSVMAHHDKPLPANGPYFEEVLWSSPSRLDPAYLARVDEVAEAAVTALGLRDCMFHAEMRTTREGPVLLEVAARMGGSPIYRSAMASSGADLVQVMVRNACRRPVPARMLAPSRSTPVVTFALFAPEGWLHAIHGLDEVRAHPGIVEAQVYEHPGTYIYRAPRAEHRTVHVMATGDTFEEAERIGTWAQQTITFAMGDRPPGAQ